MIPLALLVVLLSLEQNQFALNSYADWLTFVPIIYYVKDAFHLRSHNTKTLNAFPCGRTQHVRFVHPSIVSMIYSVFIPRAL